jgi:hypothetical protein
MFARAGKNPDSSLSLVTGGYVASVVIPMG